MNKKAWFTTKEALSSSTERWLSPDAGYVFGCTMNLTRTHIFTHQWTYNSPHPSLTSCYTRDTTQQVVLACRMRLRKVTKLVISCLTVNPDLLPNVLLAWHSSSWSCTTIPSPMLYLHDTPAHDHVLPYQAQCFTCMTPQLMIMRYHTKPNALLAWHPSSWSCATIPSAMLYLHDTPACDHALPYQAQCFTCMTLQLMIMRYHTNFGFKSLSASEESFWQSWDTQTDE